ncbi:MAG: 30S ribosomal protein S8 [Candidatus Omnitrophica bacterium]|nr:30S ribosomal protein S8 [Candidatus Omnitrophota bacterium]
MDTIANALNKIKIASQNREEKVEVLASKLLLKIVELLKQEGYIRNYRMVKGLGMGSVRVYLRYENKKPVITVLKRVSKPGLRVYRAKDRLPLIRGGLGTSILTTSKGVMTNKQAQESKVGGEILCYIW